VTAGLTVAWALAALADKTARSCDVDDVGAVAVQALALTERGLSAFLCAFSAVAPLTPDVF
jgi:hypothetical protein